MAIGMVEGNGIHTVVESDMIGYLGDSPRVVAGKATFECGIAR